MVTTFPDFQDSLRRIYSQSGPIIPYAISTSLASAVVCNFVCMSFFSTITVSFIFSPLMTAAIYFRFQNNIEFGVRLNILLKDILSIQCIALAILFEPPVEALGIVFGIACWGIPRVFLLICINDFLRDFFMEESRKTMPKVFNPPVPLYSQSPPPVPFYSKHDPGIIASVSAPAQELQPLPENGLLLDRPLGESFLDIPRTRDER